MSFAPMTKALSGKVPPRKVPLAKDTYGRDHKGQGLASRDLNGQDSIGHDRSGHDRSGKGRGAIDQHGHCLYSSDIGRRALGGRLPLSMSTDMVAPRKRTASRKPRVIQTEEEAVDEIDGSFSWTGSESRQSSHGQENACPDGEDDGIKAGGKVSLLNKNKSLMEYGKV